MPKFLILAYAVTWTVHLVYWFILWRKSQKLKQEWKEVGK